MPTSRSLSLAVLAAAGFATAASAAQLRPLPGPTATTPPAFATRATPATPTELRAQGTATDTIRIIWNDKSNLESLDATDFEVEAQAASGGWMVLGSVPGNSIGADVIGLAPESWYDFRVRAHDANGYSGYTEEADATTLAETGSCVEDATTLCLNQQRFRVHVVWEKTDGSTGPGSTIPLRDDSGLFWFFSPDNAELVVKVLDGCTYDDHYWVFAAGLTNVRVVITVADTETGLTSSWVNSQGTAFQPVQATNAFPSCS